MIFISSFNFLAIDPGTQKCGLAVMNTKAVVLKKMITPVEKLTEIVANLNREYQPAVIVIGDGTNSKDIRKMLTLQNIPIVMVDENESTIEGRYRYLKENTKGLAYLIPIGLRIPKQPFDDYVAIILAERFLKVSPGMI